MSGRVADGARLLAGVYCFTQGVAGCACHALAVAYRVVVGAVRAVPYDMDYRSGHRGGRGYRGRRRSYRRTGLGRVADAAATLARVDCLTNRVVARIPHALAVAYAVIALAVGRVVNHYRIRRSGYRSRHRGRCGSYAYRRTRSHARSRTRRGSGGCRNRARSYLSVARYTIVAVRAATLARRLCLSQRVLTCTAHRAAAGLVAVIVRAARRVPDLLIARAGRRARRGSARGRRLQSHTRTGQTGRTRQLRGQRYRAAYGRGRGGRIRIGRCARINRGRSRGVGIRRRVRIGSGRFGRVWVGRRRGYVYRLSRLRY